MKIQELLEDIDLTGTISPNKLKLEKFLKDTINVDGVVDISYNDLKKIPWKFGKITGSFYCYSCNLESLENSPSDVDIIFNCKDNKLTSLKGAPKRVGVSFLCSGNELTSLEYCPEYVGADFRCHDNKITSLVGIHKQLKHCKSFQCSSNQIEEGGLGLLLIDGLEYIYAVNPALDIVAKYLGQGKKGMMQCHAELIENGYEAYAKL